MANEIKLYETVKFTNFLLIGVIIVLVVFLISYIVIARKAETIVVETTNTFSNIFRPFSQFMQNVNNDIQTTSTRMVQNLINNPQSTQLSNNVQNVVDEFEEDLNLIIGRIQEIFSKKENIKGKKHIIEAHLEQFNELLNDIEKSIHDKKITKKQIEQYNLQFSTIYDSFYVNTRSKYLKFLALKNKY